MTPDPLAQAKFFATHHHVFRKQQLYGGVPYTHHLAAVEAVLRRFGCHSTEILTAAWLHDVVEDTDATIRDIEEQFGDDVARLVGAVTSEPGPNRKTRNALTYPKIREVGGPAVILKLADRIANVENGGAAVGMYKKEHEDFRHGLAIENCTWPEIQVMRDHLDTLLGFKKVS